MTTVIDQQAVGIRCPCGAGKPLAEAFHTPTRRYVRCPACDLVFRDPRPTRGSLEEYFQEAYDGDYGEVEASDDRQPVFQSVLRHLSSYRSPPGTLLDIGCGDGEFLVLCREAGWHCSGIELSKQAARRATHKGLPILSPHTMEGGEWAQHFDVVTLINVLETVADPAIMLQQTRTLLAPSGLVIVRATNGSFHLSMRAPARWIGSQYDQAFHWYLYSRRAMTVLMEGAGLTVLSVRNSVPSRGPLSPTHPWFSRLKWTLSRSVLWFLSQTLYYATSGHLISAPSFEIIAQRRGPR
ncbi:SAM-dependent methyltransferase [Nitrospira sp.]|nr:SAM-dependent methyltransferase [Nitrospira sp.]